MTNQTGALIKQLRLEQKMTQRAMAEHLGVSDRTISKWECGLGLPDVGHLAAVAALLGISTETLLQGQISTTHVSGRNLRRLAFYICPICGNVTSSTAAIDVQCCGRLVQAARTTAADTMHTPEISLVEDELFLRFDHPMQKDHHLQFVAMMRFDRMHMVPLYPESDPMLRLPDIRKTMLYIGCSVHGVMTLKL